MDKYEDSDFLLDFVKRYPQCQHILNSNRRFIYRAHFSISEKGAKSYTFYIFNDMIIITHGSEVENQFSLSEVFIKDLKGTSKACFLLLSTTQIYNVYLETRNKKLKLINCIENTIEEWMTDHHNRTSRISTGIRLLMSNLDTIMPLITKGWQSISKKELPKDNIDITSSLEDISEYLYKTSTSLQNEDMRRKRIEAANQIKDIHNCSREEFIIQLDLSKLPKGKGYTSFTKTFGRKLFRPTPDIILTNLGPTRSVSVGLENNYKLSLKVNPFMTVAEAKKLFYNLAVDSPWAYLVQFQKLEDYIIRIKSINFYILNEDIPIGRIPIVQAISTTTFVAPILELVLRPKDVVNSFIIDSEFEVFEELTFLLGDLNHTINSPTEELNHFRHLNANFRTKLLSQENVQLNNVQIDFPQYKGLETLPSKLPSKIQIFVYIPYLNNEKYAVKATPDTLVRDIYEKLFRYIYKREKHKTREKLKKFVKNIIDNDNTEKESDSSSQSEEYSSALDLPSNELSSSSNGTHPSPLNKRRSAIMGELVLSPSKRKIIDNDPKEASTGSKKDEPSIPEENEISEAEVEGNNSISANEEDAQELTRKSSKKKDSFKKMTKEELKKAKKEERYKKEQERKAIKEEKKNKKDKKKKDGGREKKKQKLLHKGKNINDFVLKVVGCDEYLLCGTEEEPSRLLDFDYICKCITNSTNIELKFIEKSSVVENETEFVDLKSLKIDGSISTTESDQEILEIFLDNDSKSLSAKPFSCLSNDTTSYKLKIIDLENVDVSLFDRSKMNLFIRLGLYYGGNLLEDFIYSSFVPASKYPIFNEEITFQIKTCNIPREARLSLSLFARADTNNTKPKVYSSDLPVSWINCLLFDFKGNIKKGLHAFKTWPGKANFIGTCSENNVTDSPGTLYLELYTNEQDSPSIYLKKKITKKKIKDSSISIASPTEEEEKRLFEIIDRDSLEPLEESEKKLLWKYQNWCRTFPESLPKLLLSVDWTNRISVAIIHEKLELWPAVHPITALELLDYKYPDRKVRQFAVKCLEVMNENEVYRFLMQILQALKYEPYHYSALANFLLKKGFSDPNRIGHFMFWHIKSEMALKESNERFSLLLESHIKCCGKKKRQDFIAQTKVINAIHRIALYIKNRKGSLSHKTTKLQEKLRKEEWPSTFRHPLHPRIVCTGFVIEKCKVLGSKTVPLWLEFEPAEKESEPIQTIYKVGDDLRQDSLTLQIITLTDDLWKREGLDLRLKPYSCLALSPECGIIEIVKNSNTTSNINIESGGLRAVYNDSTLLKWLKKHNPSEKALNKAKENFLLSCAGYSVITFVLGFADRHNDNIMLSKQGHLFHIDFGHFLGHYRKVLGKYVDKTDFVFIDQYYGVIGKENFPRFEEVCCRAYNILRKHANYFITLFSLMLSCDLPELQSPENIKFIKDRLQLHLTNEEAKEYFKKKLQESRENSTIQWNHAFHVVYHGMRS